MVGKDLVWEREEFFDGGGKVVTRSPENKKKIKAEG